MKKDTIKLFNLKGVIVDKVDVKKDIFIYVRSPRIWAQCPLCGMPSKKVHQKKQRKVKHGILNEKEVFLMVLVRRFKCKKCSKPFTEKRIPGVSRKRHTKQMQISALKELASLSFKHVSERYKISSPTLLEFLKEAKQEMRWPKKGKIVLNIDEHSYSGRDMKITVGVNNSLSFILKDRSQKTLIKFFESMPKDVKQRISEVCIDMHQGYLKAIEMELPQAKVVVDKFHVIKELQRQMDEIRRILQPQGEKGQRRINRFLLLKNKEDLSKDEMFLLRSVFAEYKSFPSLYRCWWVKEKMREIYRCKKYETAKKKLDQLINLLGHENIGKLKEVKSTLKRWRPYILNYFYNKTTNAFIEGCHNKIKLVKRISYGFRNFENYVLKVTLAFLPFLFLSEKLAH